MRLTGVFYQDLKYSLQGLKRNPIFALVVCVVLALGIGANTALFSVVNKVLLQPLPFAEPERLVDVHETKIHEAEDGGGARPGPPWR